MDIEQSFCIVYEICRQEITTGCILSNRKVSFRLQSDLQRRCNTISNRIQTMRVRSQHTEYLNPTVTIHELYAAKKFIYLYYQHESFTRYRITSCSLTIQTDREILLRLLKKDKKKSLTARLQNKFVYTTRDERERTGRQWATLSFLDRRDHLMVNASILY